MAYWPDEWDRKDSMSEIECRESMLCSRTGLVKRKRCNWNYLLPCGETH